MDVAILSNILTKEYNITVYSSAPENAKVDFLTMPRMYMKRIQRNCEQWWVGKL